MGIFFIISVCYKYVTLVIPHRRIFFNKYSLKLALFKKGNFMAAIIIVCTNYQELYGIIALNIRALGSYLNMGRLVEGILSKGTAFITFYASVEANVSSDFERVKSF